MIAHISLEHRPFFTVFRGPDHWQIVDAHQDVYRQPTLTVRESLTRILCLSRPLPARIHSSYPNLPPTFLDLTWQEIADTWPFVAVDLVGVWDRVGNEDAVAVNKLPTVEEDEAARLLVEMAAEVEAVESEAIKPIGMRLRSGRVLQGR
jgi:hypothetical protein